jgi:hypothetical protein
MIALKSLISPPIPPVLLPCTSVHLPGIRSTSLYTRQPRQIRWYRPPDQPMSPQLRTLQHPLRWTRPHRRADILCLFVAFFHSSFESDRATFPFVADLTASCVTPPPPLRSFVEAARSGRSTLLAFPLDRGPVLPDPKRRIRLPALLVSLDSIRTRPPAPPRGG